MSRKAADRSALSLFRHESFQNAGPVRHTICYCWVRAVLPPEFDNRAPGANTMDAQGGGPVGLAAWVPTCARRPAARRHDVPHAAAKFHRNVFERRARCIAQFRVFGGHGARSCFRAHHIIMNAQPLEVGALAGISSQLSVLIFVGWLRVECGLEPFEPQFLRCVL